MTGLERIAIERKRLEQEEGLTEERVDELTNGDLATAASQYAQNYATLNSFPSAYWPFSEEDWQPSEDPIENLAKAGALIVAEIERLEREATREG